MVLTQNIWINSLRMEWVLLEKVKRKIQRQ